MSEEAKSAEEVVYVKKQSVAAILGTNPQGMHPGVIDGWRQHPLENTCKPTKRSGKGKLGAKQARLNRRQNAHADTIKTVKQPLAFKMPGSMNPHKCAPRGKGRA